jgi:RsiW-degrading membrane proteinase PrsW (M82 family)
MRFSLNQWQLLGLILASAMLWMHYIQSKDRQQPEPPWRLALAFVLGIGACGLSVLGFHALEALGVPEFKLGEIRWTACYCFGIIGPMEEGTKVLVACLVVFRWREYDEALDGFVYAAAVALGFASLENFLNASEADWLSQLAHTVALPITHVLFSAVWGFGLGYARFCVAPGGRRVLLRVGSVALAMFAHGLYDFLTFAFQATFATSAVALALWIFMIWRAGVLGRRSAAQAAFAITTVRDGVSATSRPPTLPGNP